MAVSVQLAFGGSVVLQEGEEPEDCFDGREPCVPWRDHASTSHRHRGAGRVVVAGAPGTGADNRASAARWSGPARSDDRLPAEGADDPPAHAAAAAGNAARGVRSR